jgi:hypothetical protein
MYFAKKTMNLLHNIRAQTVSDGNISIEFLREILRTRVEIPPILCKRLEQRRR